MLPIAWTPPRASDKEIERYLGDNARLANVDRSRMSRLLCEQLVYGIVTRTLNSFAVTDVLQALERPEVTGRSIKEERFKRRPLRGLLKAHFVQASFLPKNLANELNREDGLAEIVSAVGIGAVLDDAAIGRLAYAATLGLHEKRAARKALTGEWLIYALHKGQRFYLSVAGHDEGDEIIHQRMMERCEGHFHEVLVAATT